MGKMIIFVSIFIWHCFWSICCQKYMDFQETFFCMWQMSLAVLFEEIGQLIGQTLNVHMVFKIIRAAIWNNEPNTYHYSHYNTDMFIHKLALYKYIYIHVTIELGRIKLQNTYRPNYYWGASFLPFSALHRVHIACQWISMYKIAYNGRPQMINLSIWYEKIIFNWTKTFSH